MNQALQHVRCRRHPAPGTRQLVREAGFVIEQSTVETQLERASEVPATWVLPRKPGGV